MSWDAAWRRGVAGRDQTVGDHGRGDTALPETRAVPADCGAGLGPGLFVPAITGSQAGSVGGRSGERSVAPRVRHLSLRAHASSRLGSARRISEIRGPTAPGGARGRGIHPS